MAGTISSSDASTGNVATGTWAARHPAREEINDRLRNQRTDVKDAFASGSISKSQEKQDLETLTGIRQQERQMASLNGTHLTRTEAQALNQEETQNLGALQSQDGSTGLPLNPPGVLAHGGTVSGDESLVGQVASQPVYRAA